MNRCIVLSVAALGALLFPAMVSAQKPSIAKKTSQRVPRTADGKPDLSGVWQPATDRVGTWAEANGGVGIPEKDLGVRRVEPIPYQPWAAKLVQESYNRRNAENPVARCIPQLDLGGGILYPWQFVQTPKLIVILIESRHVFRLVPIGAKHPDDLDPSYLGDSVGHWEGDTLVVDVTGFKEQLIGADIHSDAWHVVERYTRVDYNTINYEATIDDSKALTKPYKIYSKLMLRPGTRLQEYVCEENNQDPARMQQLLKDGLVTRQ
ncbi:MAG: hypothetical protein EXQ47_11360 [Bryobacterales bacterium]|nr:hypothetical protein [Bryobacterales bacterium]